VLQKLNADCGRSTGVDSLTSLIWLTLGAFAIGTEGFMIAGLLPALARDLSVGLPAAGHLVTAFSLAYAIGAPVMAVLTAGLERRRLLAVAMGGFTLGNLLAALAPGYAGLLAARLLLALSAASFMPAASGYAAALGGPERRGRALSTITIGLTLAIIAGAPLGVLVGQGFGWRATFFGVAGLAAFSLLAYLAFSLSAALGPARAMPVMLPAIPLWGLASWGLITSQQARLVALAPALAPVSLSMNSSAIYLGSATGAAAGALVIADGATERLSWVAAGFGLAALLSVLLSGSSTSGRG
jgi:predicted MFS family arabinose efflux permease